MTIHQQMTDFPIDKNAMPTNVKITPVNITMPKVNPMRDDKVELIKR